MGDWDDDDWEASDIKLTAPAAAAPAAAQLASAGNPDAKQFADEEDIVEDEPEHHVPKTQVCENHTSTLC